MDGIRTGTNRARRFLAGTNEEGGRGPLVAALPQSRPPTKGRDGGSVSKGCHELAHERESASLRPLPFPAHCPAASWWHVLCACLRWKLVSDWLPRGGGVCFCWGDMGRYSLRRRSLSPYALAHFGSRPGNAVMPILPCRPVEQGDSKANIRKYPIAPVLQTEVWCSARVGGFRGIGRSRLRLYWRRGRAFCLLFARRRVDFALW